LKTDYEELFANTQDHTDVLVKEKYEVYPNIKYPMVTIEEITNEPVDRYWDGDNENVSYLAYQIDIYGDETEELTARQLVQELANIIDDYMKGERYKCMRRVGTIPIVPLQTDDNIMIGHLRYECYLDINNNIIYRR